MKATQLIRNSGADPEVLAMLFKAFDEAWNEIKPSIGADALAQESARLRLANVILSLARADRREEDNLPVQALRIFRSEGLSAK